MYDSSLVRMHRWVMEEKTEESFTGFFVLSLSLPWVVARAHSSPSNLYAMSLSRLAHLRINTQGFYWGLVTKAPLPRTYRSSRLPGGKQVFIKTRGFYHQSRHSKPTLSVWGRRQPPRARFPVARRGPIFQAGLPKDSSLKPAMFTLFRTGHIKVTMFPHFILYRENFLYYEMFLKTIILMIV